MYGSLWASLSLLRASLGLDETVQLCGPLGLSGPLCGSILESVEKTGRLVIIHEAARSFGVGAEIAATVAEKGLYDLKGPIRRVTGYDTIMPYFRREMDYMPSVKKISDAISAVVAQ